MLEEGSETKDKDAKAQNGRWSVTWQGSTESWEYAGLPPWHQRSTNLVWNKRCCRRAPSVKYRWHGVLLFFVWNDDWMRNQATSYIVVFQLAPATMASPPKPIFCHASRKRSTTNNGFQTSRCLSKSADRLLVVDHLERKKTNFSPFERGGSKVLVAGPRCCIDNFSKPVRELFSCTHSSREYSSCYYPSASKNLLLSLEDRL